MNYLEVFVGTDILIIKFSARERFPDDGVCLNLQTGRIEHREEQGWEWRQLPCIDDSIVLDWMSAFADDLGPGEPGETLRTSLQYCDPFDEFWCAAKERGLWSDWEVYRRDQVLGAVKAWLQDLELKDLYTTREGIVWLKPTAIEQHDRQAA
jgi:hypothetical protein